MFNIRSIDKLMSTTVITKVPEEFIEFSFHKPEYQMDTFSSRFLYFFTVMDPRNFFVSSKRLKECKDIIKTLKEKEEKIRQPLILNKTDYNELRKALTIVNSATSKETGADIPRIMRMCAFTPMNVPIIYGMLISPPSTATIVFWQWFN